MNDDLMTQAHDIAAQLYAPYLERDDLILRPMTCEEVSALLSDPDVNEHDLPNGWRYVRGESGYIIDPQTQRGWRVYR